MSGRCGLLLSLLTALGLSACSSVLTHEKAQQIQINDEFEQAVKIEKPPEEAPTTSPPPGTLAAEVSGTAPTPSVSVSQPKKARKKSPPQESAPLVKKALAKKPPKPEAPVRRQPDIEDDEGFDGRRPLVDPFTVGEEVVHDVHYFKVSAGELRLSVKPFAMVNGRKSYNFVTAIRTKGLFSSFYSVDDIVETLVDYETLLPSVYELHVKESDQLREAKMLFNHETNMATFWEKKVTKKSGVEEKKYQWELAPYSQNVFSVLYYMRAFKWETGKEYSFRIGNDEENIVFKGTAIRREVLDTKLGPMKAIVIKPEITLKGKFKPIGDNYIWLSDDEHKHLIRIESKIKIGTLVSEVIEIKK